ncbi:uncharacterized protein LOC135491742 isoform X4 [Lineus longissimus]|uniref:uncharacterized protein LOC135491742 isoform X4 n=1 Tax=Lineus longissimus TaxID=88925 RepID=UPI00315D9837
MSCDTEKMISCSEEEFDRALQEINMKVIRLYSLSLVSNVWELVLIISKLQAAMIAEQQHFSTIHNQIEKLPNKSGAEHAALSEQLVKSQEKIGQLMQRNMKCFNAKTATEKASKSVMDKSAIHSKVPESGPAKPPVMIASAKMEDPHPKKQGPQPKVNATQVPVTVVPNDTRNGTKFQTGKMASFKKDKSDNNNLKGSIDIPDDNGVTEAVSMAEYQGQDAKDVDEELVKERTTLLHWDPVKLLDDLYEIKQAEDHADDLSSSFIQMAGYMEKLPMNKKKATMLKTWKRRYFKAKDGNLFYYDGNHSDKPTGFIQLLGGSVEDAENRMIGIDDGRGHYCLLRCPTDREHQDWIVALNSQVSASPMALYVKPSINPKPHFRKKVVIIDIGGASVRGGVIGMEPSLPQVFFPCVVAINKTTGEKVFGFDAFKPEIRSQSNLIFPLRKSAHVDKVNLDKDILPGLLKKVFNELKRHPTMYHLILSTPHTLSAKTLSNLMDSMLEEFQVKALSMVYQPIMALYSYSATSGVVVDIGERCDVVPVIDGFLMTAGISRQPYGAVAITELLNQNLAEHKFRFHTDVEKLFTRLVLERACYVSQNFNEDNEKCIRDREPFTHHIDVGKYNLPEDTFTELTCDSGRFRAAEGLFDTELYGQDTPFLHKAIHKAIQDCPMDSRREMCRSIYLSGGTTMLPGFAERLKTLMETLVPKSCVVEVHASPHRYHAAYIGACIQAGLDGFEQSCITLKEWKNNPQDCLRRLQSF